MPPSRPGMMMLEVREHARPRGELGLLVLGPSYIEEGLDARGVLRRLPRLLALPSTQAEARRIQFAVVPPTERQPNIPSSERVELLVVARRTPNGDGDCGSGICSSISGNENACTGGDRAAGCGDVGYAKQSRGRRKQPRRCRTRRMRKVGTAPPPTARFPSCGTAHPCWVAGALTSPADCLPQLARVAEPGGETRQKAAFHRSLR